MFTEESFSLLVFVVLMVGPRTDYVPVLLSLRLRRRLWTFRYCRRRIAGRSFGIANAVMARRRNKKQ